MKRFNLLFFAIIFVFGFSACKKDPGIQSDPTPGPTPVYNATISIKLSPLPDDWDGFIVTTLAVADLDGWSLVEFSHSKRKEIQPPQYDWELDSAFVREHKGKNLLFVFNGAMIWNGLPTGMGVSKIQFILTVKPGINEFYFEIPSRASFNFKEGE